MTIRAPHFSPRRERLTQQPDLVANLLVTTLAVAVGTQLFVDEVPAAETQQPLQLGSPFVLLESEVAKPFAQTDWKNPRTSGLLEVLQVGRSITEIPAAQKPFAQTDWKNPETLFIHQPEQIGKSVALVEAAVAAPFIQSDWLNPEPVSIQSPHQVGLPLTILEDAGEKPFNLSDWPQPELRPTPIPEQVPKSIALVEAEAAAPFFQTDWSNPTLSIDIQTPFQVGKSIALVEVAVAIPFAQHDWPNYVIPLFIDAFHRGPQIIPPAPFKQIDWPNPSVDIQIQTPLQLGLPLGILEDAGEKPFAQYDWLNPEPIFIKQPEQVGKSVTLVETVVSAPPSITVSARFTTPENASARFREPFGPHLLLEDGSGVLLLEDGCKLLLECDPNDDSFDAIFSSTVTIKGNF